MSFRWTFQGIISLLIAAIVMVPLLLTGVLLWYLLSPNLERQQFQTQAALAQSVSEQISSYLANGVNELEIFAYHLSEQIEFSSDTQLNAFARLTPLFEVVYLVDDAGVVQFAGVPESSNIRVENLKQLDISRMRHFTEMKSGKTGQWSEGFLSSASGELVVAYSLEIPDQGNYRYFVAELSIHSLPELLQKIQQNNGLTVMIFDAADQLVGHPDASLSHQQINLSNLNLLNAPTTEFGQIGQFRFQENQYYGSLINIPDPAWKIVVATPVDQFWSLFFVALRSIAFALVFGAVAVILLSRWISKLIDSYFAQYRAIANRLARGDYDIYAPKSSIVDLQAFGRDLVRTGEAIASRESELASMNAELEERVNARTQDLTLVNQDLKETLERLQQAQNDLVESGKLAALGSLVAGVSHELNTPIGVSVTASTSVVAEAKDLCQAMENGQLSKSQFIEGLSHIQQGSELIAKNLTRAAELILSFKQVAVDQSSDKRRQFNLGDVLLDVIATMKPKFKTHKIEFVVQNKDDVEMDSFPGSLIQVISNLVDNAVLHGYDGKTEGQVTVKSRLLSARQIEIQVKDDGLGISSANMAHIFEPFFTTRLGRGGSGLGLNIVHSIVEKILGGHIRVASAENKGTTFTLKLPVVAPTVHPQKVNILDSDSV